MYFTNLQHSLISKQVKVSTVSLFPPQSSGTEYKVLNLFSVYLAHTSLV